MQMDYRKMGEVVRTWRKFRNMTQERLAEQAGICSSFVGHIERGSRICSMETLMGMAEALKVDPNWLMRCRRPGDPLPLPGIYSQEERDALEEMCKAAMEAIRVWDESQKKE